MMKVLYKKVTENLNHLRNFLHIYYQIVLLYLA